MMQIKKRLLRYATVATHTTILMLAVVKTTIKRLYRKIRKLKIEHPHLQSFITRRSRTKCNLTSLSGSLNEHSSSNVIISNIVDKQPSYTTKNELLAILPDKNESTEMIAIPLAVEVFSVSRHFVTMIIDFRAQIIEFYDPIGYSLAQYNNTRLWGPKCKRADRLTISELAKSVQKKYQIDKIIENREMHQKDVNQCALFVYDRIYKRATKGLSFEKASMTPLTSKQAFI